MEPSAEATPRHPRAAGDARAVLRSRPVAIYHLRVSTGSRGGGQSAAAKWDYIHREGRYRRDPGEVVHAEQGNLPVWARGDPRAYWAAADAHERANGRLFREVEFALPNELDGEQQARLARRFAEELAAPAGERLPWALAIHRGRSREAGKPDNPHCHLVLSERINDGIERGPERWFKRYNARSPERGGARKSSATRPRSWLEGMRERWAELANEALERAGHGGARIDARTLEEQREEALERGREEEAERLDREPGVHVGPAATAIERGREGRPPEATERGGLQREVERANRARRLLAALQRWIDLTERLLAAGRELWRRQARRRKKRQQERSALWDRYKARWPRQAAADERVFEAVERLSGEAVQAVRDRFTKLHPQFRGERAKADPLPLPDALAPAGRPWQARKAATPGAYRASLPERYRKRWDRLRLSARCRRAQERWAGSLRARLTPQRKRRAGEDAAVRREGGRDAQRLDRAMHADRERHRPQWEVIRRIDRLREEERYRAEQRERIGAGRERVRSSMRLDRLRRSRPRTRDDDRDHGPSR